MNESIRKGLWLEYGTLAWNVIGCGIVISAGLSAHSVSLFGFGIDSVIEILASIVVIWQLKAVNKDKEKFATKLIGIAFILLSLYIIVQDSISITHHVSASPSVVGIVWLAITALVMFILAYGKKKVGTVLNNPVLLAESKVTVIDGLLAASVLLGLLLNILFHWPWTDVAASLIIVWYGTQEAMHALK